MRRTPITLAFTMRLPSAEVFPGELHIHERAGSLNHPVGGFLSVGEETLPLIGEIRNLRIERQDSPARGRPTKTARDVGVYLAHHAIARTAARPGGEPTFPPSPGQRRWATQEVLQLWQRWPGIQDESAVRRSLKKAEAALKGAPCSLLTYTGHAADMSDFATVLLMQGANTTVASGRLHATGPAWVWRWGQERAEFGRRFTVVAETPEARDFIHRIGQ